MAKEVSENIARMYNSLTNNTKIAGKLVADSDIRIDGEILGDLSCNGKVVIGENGYIKGSISCISAEIIGTIDGDIIASESVILRSTAEIKSDVYTKRLIIEPKARFVGFCSLTNLDNNSAKV